MINILFAFLILQFTWDAPLDSQVDSYRIYRVTNTTKKIAEVKTTSYKLSNPALGKQKYYVTAVNTWGESDKSNAVEVEIVKQMLQAVPTPFTDEK